MPPELTFTSQRGARVLDPERRKPIIELAVGTRVLVPSMFGYIAATVCLVEPFGLTCAESRGLLFILEARNGEWWCDSSVSKEAAEWLGKMLSDAP
jgi:hypothetical protein